MTVEERLKTAELKIEQAKHQQILRENRSKAEMQRKETAFYIKVGKALVERLSVSKEFLDRLIASENYERMYDFIDGLIGAGEAYEHAFDVLLKEI